MSPLLMEGDIVSRTAKRDRAPGSDRVTVPVQRFVCPVLTCADIQRRRLHLTSLTPDRARRSNLWQGGRAASADDRNPARVPAEAVGILTWAVRGCLAWRQGGLQAPAAVLDATREYQQDSDTLARFIAAKCVVSPHVRVRAGELFAAYERWCDAERIGEDRLSLRAFGERLKVAYAPLAGSHRHVTYGGIGLIAEEGE